MCIRDSVTGLTLTIFGVAFGNMIGDALMRSAPGGAAVVSAKVSGAFSRLSIPLLSDIPYVGKLFFQYNIFVYLGIAIAIGMALFLKHTPVSYTHLDVYKRQIMDGKVVYDREWDK